MEKLSLPLDGCTLLDPCLRTQSSPPFKCSAFKLGEVKSQSCRVILLILVPLFCSWCTCLLLWISFAFKHSGFNNSIMDDPQPWEWAAPGFSEFEDLLSLYPIGFCSNGIHKNGFGRMGKDLNHCFGEQYIRGNHAGEAKRDVCENQVTFVITNVSGLSCQSPPLCCLLLITIISVST